MTEQQAREDMRAAFDALKSAEDAEVSARRTWQNARLVLRGLLSKRKPREDELRYAYSTCSCGAHLAYWEENDGGCWDCADILLGRSIPKGEAGSVQHTDKMPFAFWIVEPDNARPSVEPDNARKTARDVLLKGETNSE